MDIDKLMMIGIALSKERDRSHLLETILLQLIDITSCDGGILYLKKDYTLAYEVMVIKSQNIYKGGGHEAITLPAISLSEENICAYVLMHGELCNIADIRNNPLFDFSVLYSYEAMTGYCTTSMLVVPMEDGRGAPIGVLQLINALDSTGTVIPFLKEYEKIAHSLASQAAICFTNMMYSLEIQSMLDSFVRVFVMAVDARSPYNANHTRNMARYAARFLEWLKETRHPLAFSEEKTSEFLMSIWLHDIGKLVIPLEVMDKQDRLGQKSSILRYRFSIISLHNQLAFARGRITEKELKTRTEHLEEVKDFIQQANTAEILSDEQLEKVQALGRSRWEDADGREHPWLTSDETIELSVKKGTLTDAERSIMQSHVLMTRRFLEQMHFPKRYTHVPGWASAHHELLNGSGYPEKLSAEQIPIEVRFLTILDVFEALTANDRPYKRAMPLEKALQILEGMAEDGEIDKELLQLFVESQAWFADKDEKEKPYG